MRIGLLRAFCGSLALALLALPLAGGPAHATGQSTGIRAYVANTGSNDVSVLDVDTETVVATIPLDNSYANPVDVAAAPDGSAVYVVTNSGSSVAAIDTATNTVTGTLALSGVPTAVTVAADGSRVYITDAASDLVTVIDVAGFAEADPIAVGSAPVDLAVSPSGSRLYVANGTDDTVSVIDTATETVVSVVPVCTTPYGVTVAPDGDSLYVACLDSSVNVVDTATNTVASTINTDSPAFHVAVSPDGDHLYVATDQINEITTSNGTTTFGLQITSTPGGAEVAPDGGKVLVSDSTNDRVTIFDAPLTVASTTRHTTVGAVPAGIAFAVPAVKAPPLNAEAEQVPGIGKIKVSWDAPSQGSPTGYQVYVASPANGTYALLTTGPCSALADTDLTCTQTDLTPGTEYNFRVTALYDAEESDPSVATGGLKAIEPPGATATPSAATNGSGSMQITWTATSGTAAAPVTGHELEMSSDGGSSYAAVQNGTCTTMSASPCTVTQLTGGTTYRFRLVAKNAAGTTQSAGSTGVAAIAAPGQPGTPTTTVDGHTALKVTWTGSGDHFRVYASTLPTTGFTAVTSGPCADPVASPCRISGLTVGTGYYFKVSAVSSGLEGTPSNVSDSTTVLGLPGQPGTPTVTVTGDRTLQLAWGAVSGPAEAYGTPVDSYQVETSAGGAGYTVVSTGTCASPTTRSCTMTDLTAGTSYKFRVTAVNTIGSGTVSLESSTQAAVTTPSAPTQITATRAHQSVNLTLTAPGNDGGSAVTGYQVSTNGGTTWAALTVTNGSATVSGLVNGTTYAIRVRAVNIVGEGATGDAGSVTPATSPAAPTTLTVTPGNASAAVSFVPGDNGGNTVIRYEVSTDNGANWATLTTAAGVGAARTGTVTGLTNQTSYSVRVRAVNDVGPGSASGAEQVTPTAAAPGTPTALSATAGDRSLSVSFLPPASDGGSPILRYDVSVDNGQNWNTLPTTAGAGGTEVGTVTGLVNGTTYTVRVRAVNNIGPSTETSAIQATPAATAPGAPTSLTVTAGDRSLSLSFLPPASDGGSTILEYDVSLDDGQNWADLATTAGAGGTEVGTVASLVNGTTYTVRVRAVNGIGPGTASSAQQATATAAVPDAPTGLTATAGDRSLSLTFLPPAYDGGSAILGYDVSVDNGQNWADLTTLPGAGGIETGTVAGLANGTTYAVRVRAVNVSGPGSPTDAVSMAPVASAPVTLPPGVPGGLTARPGNASIRVTFTPPATDGGSPITGYEVSTDDGSTWAGLTTQAGAGGTRTGTVGGLANGITYRLQVRAVNVVGAGQPAVAGAVLVGILGAPTAVTATAGISSITVTWAAPAENAGLVTDYTATADPGPATCSPPTPGETTCTLGGTAGISYTVTVVAHSAGGTDSAPSGPSNAVTPMAPEVPETIPDIDADLTTDRGPIDEASPGQEIVVIGTGFAPHSTVTIAIYSAPTVLATVTTDDNGSFTQSVIVPPDLPVGAHTFVASGVDADGEPYAMKLAVTVAPPSPGGGGGPGGGGPGGDGPGSLPATGPGATPMVAVGLLLIAVGAAARISSRTRGVRSAGRSGHLSA